MSNKSYSLQSLPNSHFITKNDLHYQQICNNKIQYKINRWLQKQHWWNSKRNWDYSLQLVLDFGRYTIHESPSSWYGLIAPPTIWGGCSVIACAMVRWPWCSIFRVLKFCNIEPLGSNKKLEISREKCSLALQIEKKYWSRVLNENFESMNLADQLSIILSIELSELYASVASHFSPTCKNMCNLDWSVHPDCSKIGAKEMQKGM